MKKHLLLFAIVFGAAAAFMSAQQAPGAASFTAAQATSGRAAYDQNCASCHAFGEFKTGRIGPDLTGVMGRRSGTLPGYDYSPAFRKAQTQVTWRRDTLSGFLSTPSVLFPGTRMNVAGIEAFADRESIGDFLLGAPAGRTRANPGAAPKPR